MQGAVSWISLFGDDSSWYFAVVVQQVYLRIPSRQVLKKAQGKSFIFKILKNVNIPFPGVWGGVPFMPLPLCLRFPFLSCSLFLAGKAPGNGAVALESSHHQAPQHQLALVEVVMDVK